MFILIALVCCIFCIGISIEEGWREGIKFALVNFIIFTFLFFGNDIIEFVGG